MALKVWISDKSFPHTRENEMITTVIKNLEAVFGQVEETIHLLCNFSIPGNTKRYVSTLDLAVLRPRHLTIIELKNYRGAISGAPEGAWTCETEGGLVVIQGGKANRNPIGQASDYHEQMTKLLKKRLNPVMKEPFDKNELKHLVSSVVVFPDTEYKEPDHLYFEPEKFSWLKVVRLHQLARVILERSNDSKKALSPRMMALLVGDIFKLREAFLVDGFPMLKAGAEKPTAADFGAKPGDPEDEPVSPRELKKQKRQKSGKNAKRDQAKDGTPSDEKQASSNAEKTKGGISDFPFYNHAWKIWKTGKNNRWKFNACCDALLKMIEPRTKKIIQAKKATDIQGAWSIVFKGDRFLLQKLPNLHSIHKDVQSGKTKKVKDATLNWTLETLCRAIEFLHHRPIPEALLALFDTSTKAPVGKTDAKVTPAASQETEPTEQNETAKRSNALTGRPPYALLAAIWKSDKNNREKLVQSGTILEETLEKRIDKELQASASSDSDEAFFRIFKDKPQLQKDFQDHLPLMEAADNGTSGDIDNEMLARAFQTICRIVELCYRKPIPRNLRFVFSPSVPERETESADTVADETPAETKTEKPTDDKAKTLAKVKKATGKAPAKEKAEKPAKPKVEKVAAKKVAKATAKATPKKATGKAPAKEKAEKPAEPKVEKVAATKKATKATAKATLKKAADKAPAKAKKAEQPAEPKVEKAAEPKAKKTATKKVEESTAEKPKATAKAKKASAADKTKTEKTAAKTTVKKPAEDKPKATAKTKKVATKAPAKAKAEKPTDKAPAKAKAEKAADKKPKTAVKAKAEKPVTKKVAKAPAKAKKATKAKAVPIPENIVEGYRSLLKSHKANGQKLEQLWTLMDAFDQDATKPAAPKSGPKARELRENLATFSEQRQAIEKEHPSRLASSEVRKALQASSRILELTFGSPFPKDLREALD